MRSLNFLVIIVLLLNSCSSPNAETAGEEKQADPITDQISTSESILELDTTSEQETEVELALAEIPVTFDSIGRPSRPVFLNLEVDTAQLFGVWADEHSYPNAAFLISRDEYYIADYEGDPIVPYVLEGDSLTLFFEWGIETSRISFPTPNLLIMSGAKGRIYEYKRFEN